LLQVNLGGTLDINGNNQSVANLSSVGTLPGTGGSIINSGAAATLRIGFNASQTWAGGINGANLNVVRDGGSTWTVTSGNSFAGTLVLQGGATLLQDSGAFSGTTGITIRRSALIWDDNVGIQALSNRLNSNVALTMNGGAFVFRSRSGQNGVAQVGDVTLGSGASLFTVTPTNGTSQITLNSLSRTANTGAAATFSSGGAVGDNGRIVITNAPTLVNGIIGAWATAIGIDPIAGGGSNAEFATYDPASGIRLAGTYSTALVAGAFGSSLQNTNVRQSGNVTLGAGGITVNTLTMNNAAAALTFAGATDVLTLTAGGLLTGLDNNAKSIGTAAVRGQLTAGTGVSELFIHVGQNVLTINSAIIDNGNPLNLVLDGLSQVAFTNSTAPTITLTGANTYTGTTFVNNVIVNLNTPGAPAIRGNLVISGGNSNGTDSAPIANSVVTLQQNNQIATTAAVTLNGGAQLNLNNFNNTIASLVFTNDGGSNGNNGPALTTGSGTLTVAASQPLTATTTTGSNTLVFATAPGDFITNGTPIIGVGIPVGTVITGRTSSTSYTLSSNATASGSIPVPVSASTTSGSNQLTFAVAPGGGTLPPGTPVSGPGIAPGTTIVSGSGSTYTLSQNAVATSSGSLAFGGIISASNLANANSIPVLNGFLDTSAGVNFNVAASSVLPGQIGLELNSAMNSGFIIKSGAGVLGIGGQSSFSGVTSILAGTLAFGQAGAFIGNSQVNLAGGTTLDARGLAGITGLVVGSGTITNYNLSTQGTVVTGFDNASGTFSGTFTSPFANGLLNVTKIGTGTWTLTGDSTAGATASVSNVFTVNQGTTVLNGTSGRLNFRTYTVSTGGALTLDNSTDNLINRLGGPAYTDISTIGANRTLTIQGGTVTLRGASTIESIGTLTIQNGAGVLNNEGKLYVGTLTAVGSLGGTLLLNGSGTVGVATTTTASGSSASTTITVASAAGLSIGQSVAGTGIPGSNFITGISGNTITLLLPTTGALSSTSVTFGGITTPNLLGGNGVAGTRNMSVRPDIIMDTRATGGTIGFATYVASTGLRLLSASTELDTSLGTQPVLPAFAAAGTAPGNNVSLSSLVNMTVNSTINSLVLQSKGGVFFAGGTLPALTNSAGTLHNATGTLHTLIVSSGGILALAGNAGITGGVLTTNTTNPLIFHTMGDLTLNSFISGTSTQGFIKSGNGSLFLKRSSLISGITTVNAGTLVLGSGASNTLLVTMNATAAALNDLRVNGGSVDLSGSSQMVGALSSNATSNIGGVTTALASSGGTITNTGVGAVNFYTSSAAGTSFGGTITNTGGALSLYKSGIGNLILTSAQTYTGSTNVLGGTLTLRDNGALSQTSAINIKYATLTFDNQGLAENTSRIPTAAPISLSGGAIIINGRQAIDTQSIGAVTLAEGSSSVTINQFGGATSGAYALTLANLSRTAANGGVLNFVPGAGLTVGGTTNTPTAGAQPQFFLNQLNGVAFNQASMVNGIIGGWAVVNGSEFASYRDTLGISALGNTAAGYAGYGATDINATTTAATNVNDGGNRTLTVSKTINSLRNAPGAAQTLTLGTATTPVTLTLGSGGYVTNANFAIGVVAGAVGSAITSGSSDFFVWVNQNTTTISSKITGNNGLVKSGPGTLVLGAAASLSSTTTNGTALVTLGSTTGLQVGQLVTGTGIAANTTIVSIDSPTQVTLSQNSTASGTATLSYSLASTGVTWLTVGASSTTINSATVTVPSTTGLTVGMPVAGTGIPAGTTISSIDVDGIRLTLSQNATATNTGLTLAFNQGSSSNNALNNYAGATIVNQGTLSLSTGVSGTILIPGDLKINGGAVTFANTNTGQIAATSNITISGSGTFTLPNYSATTTNTFASLTLNGTGGSTAPTFAFGTPTASSTVVLTAANAITVVNDNLAFTPIISTSAAALSALNLSNNNPVINVSGLSPQGLIINVPLNYTGTGGQITKTGNGSLVFSGATANILTGGLRISGGTVIFDNTAGTTPYGTGTITLDDGVAIMAGTAARTISNPFAVSGGFTFGGSPNGSAPTVNNLTLGGTVTLASGIRTITVASPLVTATISGKLTGGSGVVKAGAGTLVLSSNTNDYGGTTTVSGGLLRLGVAGAIPDGSGLVVAATGVFDIAGLAETVGSLAGAGLITNSAAVAATLTIGADGTSTTFSGVITQGTTSVLNLIKTGAGIQSFSGLNSYLGKTSIQNGAISVTSLKNTGLASGLGAPTTNGTIDLGLSGTSAGGLIYTGSGDTTDRVINLAGTTSGGYLESSGGGAILFTSAFTATGAGSKTLTLQGSNTGDNTIGGAIVDNSVTNLTALTKSGTGTWVLSGANTYTGTTTINGGTLILRRATAGVTNNTAITVNSGTLRVDGAYTAGLTSTANAGATVNLTAGSTFTMSRDNAVSNFSLVQASSVATGLTITSANLAFDIGGLATGTDKIAVTRGVIINSGSPTRVSINPLTGIPSITANITTGYDLITSASASLSGSANLTLATPFLLLSPTVAYSLTLKTDVAGKVSLLVANQAVNTLYWAGGTSNGWNNAANWKSDPAGSTAGSIPDNVDTVNFTANSAGNLTTTLGQNIFVGTVNFTGAGTTAASSSVTIGGGFNLTIYGSLNVAAGSAAHTISAPVVLGASQTWTIGNSASNPFTVSGIISDNSNGFGLTKAGVGTLALTNAANTYSGPTVISGGVLNVSTLANGGAASSIGSVSTSAANLVLSGGTLQYNGSANASTNRLFTLLTAGGTIDSSGSGTLSFTGTGRMDQTDLTGTGTLINSVIDTGTGSITTPSFRIDNVNTAGLTVGLRITGQGIPAGATITSIDAANNRILISQAINYDDDGDYSNGVPATVSLAVSYGAARTLTLTGTNTGANTLSTLLSDTNGGASLSLVKTGAGNWGLAGTNTFTGTVSIQNGSLTVSSLNSVNGGTPLLASSSLGAPIDSASGTISLGSLNNAGTLIYTGVGEQTDRIFALTGTTGGGTIVSSGTGALVINSDLAVTGAGSKTLTLAGADAHANEVAGIISNNSGSNLTSLVKSGAGTWILSGANTYSGATSILDGILSVSSINRVSGGTSSSSMGAPTTLANGTVVLGNASSTGTLLYTGAGETTDRVFNLAGTTGGGSIQSSGTGALTFTGAFSSSGAGAKTLTVGGTYADSSNRINGVISDNAPANPTSFVKAADASSWILGGVNTYTGTTTVNGGLLQVGVGGVGRTGTGATVINSGATLAGSGLINGTASVTNHVISSGAILSPGDLGGASNGTLTFNGNLQLASGSIANFQVSGRTGNDGSILAQLVGGTYDSSGGYRDSSSTLTLWNSYLPTSAQHDFISLNGTLLLGQTTFNVLDSGFVGNARLGDVLNLGNWLAVDGGSTFNVGNNYRTGGTGGGNLNLPTLNGGLVYDVSKFLSDGVIVIITTPPVIPVKLSSYNLAGSASWNLATSWSPATVPNSSASIAVFTSNITSNAIVTLDGSKTVGKVIVGDQNNTNFFTLAQGSGGGSLVFDNGAYGKALLSKVLSNSGTVGVDVVATTVLLNTDLNINVNSGGAAGRMDISGEIWQNTAALGVTIMGAGRVTYSGITPNTYTGDTRVFNRGFGDATNAQLVLGKAQSTNGGTAIFNTTSGSSLVTVSGNIVTKIYPGMSITGVSAIPASAVVNNVVYNAALDRTEITLSSNATAAAITAAPYGAFGSLAFNTSQGSGTITATGNYTNRLVTGMPLGGNPNIPAGALVGAVSYNATTNITSVTLISNVTNTATSATATANGVATTYGSFASTFLQRSFTANTTNGSTTLSLTGGATTAGFFVGMPVSGTNIPAGATVSSINANGTQFTISAGATATGTDVAVVGNSGSNVVNVGSTVGFYPGMPVTGNPNLPAGTVVVSVLSATSFIASNPATATGTAVTTVFGSNVTNGTIAGNLIIGNMSMGGLGSAVVALGGPDQIADTALLRFDAGNGAAATGNSGNNAYFKTMGYDETVRGLSDYTASGVIENTEGEANPYDSTLTLNTTDTQSYNGFLRNRANNNGSGILNLIVSGRGTQVLALGNINYTGFTTINTGSTLVLDSTTNYNSIIVNNGSLGLRSSGTTFNFAEVVTGTGSGFRDGGGGTVAINSPNQQATWTAGSTTVTVGSTAGLVVGMPVSGTGIQAGSTIASIINGTQYSLSVAPTAGATLTNLNYSGALQKAGANTNSTVINSTTMTVANTTGLAVGMAVSGSNIPNGTVIRSITDSTRIVLSAAATATNNGQFYAFGSLVSFNGGFTVNDGAITTTSTTNFNAPTIVGGTGFNIRGLASLVNVNWNQPVNVASGGLHLKGTGDNVINGVVLNIQSASNVTGVVNIAGSDVRINGDNGSLTGVTAINLSGSGNSANGNTLPGLNILNRATVVNSVLDTTSNLSDRLPNTTAINLNAGRLLLIGQGDSSNTSAVFSETLGALTLLGGSNFIGSFRSNATSNTLTFSSFAGRSVGATVFFDSLNGSGESGGVINITGMTNNSTGIIGGWATRSISVSNTQLFEWAAVSGSTITGYSAYSTAGIGSWTSAALNIKMSGGNQTSNTNSAYTVHSLNIQDNSGGRTLTIASGSVLRIDGGGVLSSRNNHVIAGPGSITAGTSSGAYELIFQTPSNQITVNAVVADNGSNLVALVKSGAGTLILNPNTTKSTATIVGNNVVTINAGGSADLRVGATVSGTGIQAGTTINAINGNLVTLSAAPTVTATNTLTYGVVNTYSGKTILNEGIAQITRESDLGANPASFVADQLFLNGGRLLVNDTMSFDDTNRGITIGATDGLISVSDNRKLTMGNTNTIDGRLGRLIFVTDASREGVLEIAGNNNLSGGLETNGTTTTGVATLASTYSNGSTTIRVGPGLVDALEVGATVTGQLVILPDGTTTTTSFGIQEGTTINAIDKNTGTITISKPVTTDGNGINVEFGGFNVMRLTGNNNIGFIRVLGSAIALRGNNTLEDDISVNNGKLMLGYQGAGTNVFNGTLTLNSGTVIFNSDTALQTTSGAGYTLRLLGGVMDLNGYDTTVSSISGSGTLTNEGTGVSVMTVNSDASFNFAGIIRDGFSGTGSVSVVKGGQGVLGLTGVNGYSGPTVINGGTLNVNSISFGGVGSSIGDSSNAAANVVLNGGVLRYSTNISASTDRAFTLGTGNAAGALVADGTRLSATLKWGTGSSHAVAFTGTGDRTLTLGGSNRGDNKFDVVLGDGAGGLTSLAKIGNGTWVVGSAVNRQGTTASGSNQITMTDTSRIRVGQQVSGTGIPAGSTVVSIDANNSITISTNATANGAITVSVLGNSYSGETVVLAGILATSVDGGFGAQGGAGVVVGGGTNGSTVLGNQNATLDLRNVNYTTIEQLFLSGGTLATTTGNSTWVGTITVSANSNILVNAGATLTLTGNIAGAGSITQLGAGTLILKGAVDTTTRNSTASAMVPSYTVQAGTLQLDYTTNGSSKLSDTGSLTLGGGRLGGAINLVGGSHVEIVSGTTIGIGSNSISRLSGSSILRLNGLGVQAGGTVNFGSNNIASTDTGNINGILGGWATVGGNDWATRSTTNDQNGALTTGVGLTYGQTVSGTGIPAGTTIVALSNNGVSITLSNAATITATSNLTFGAATLTTSGTGDTTGAGTTLTLTGTNATSGLTIGQSVSGANIPAGAVIVGIVDGNNILISQPATATGTGISFTFGSATLFTNSTSVVALSSGSNTAVTGQDGLITAFTGYLPSSVANDWVLPTAANSGANMDIVGPSTQNNTTPNTLRFNTPNNSATNMTVTLSGVNVLQGSGILVTSGVGSDVTVINGSGTLSGGAGVNSDLRIYQNNTLAPLEISAVIANLAPTSRSGTTTSDTSIITGVNVAGLAPGLTVSGTGIASGSTISSIDAVNGTITLNTNVTQTGTTPISFTTVANGLSKTGLGNLILSGLNTYSGVNTLNGGVLTVRQLSVEGFASGSVLTTQNATTTRAVTLSGTSTTGLTFGQTVTGTGLPPVVSLSSNTTSGSNLIVVSSTAGLSNGLPVVGAGIPAGAVIQGINNATNTVTISVNASATASGAAINYGGATIAAINSDSQITLTNGATLSATQNLTYGQISGVSGNLSSTTTNNSATVTLNNNATTAGLTPGQAITGTNIPVGAVIATIIDGTRFTMTLTATGSGTNNLLYADPTSLLKSNVSLASITTSSSRLVLPSTVGLTLGQTVSGTGIPAGAVIIRIVDAHNVDLSVPVTSTGTNNLTFSAPTVLGATLAANTTSGSTTVTFASSVTGLAVGQVVTGSGIAVGTTIAAILSDTQIVLSSPVQFTAASSSLVFAGPASNLGASSNAAANLVLNNGTFQYNGLSAVSDRGFTINADGIFDVGNAFTQLIMAGTITTPAAEENYRLIKLGAGLLELRGTLTPNAGSYGISSVIVNDGTLRLNATFSDQFVRNDVGTLTLGGGALELVGAPDRSTVQNMIGTFSLTEGASVVTVSNVLGSNVDTTLNLQDITTPSKVSFGTGSTALFVENPNGTGDANITLAGVFGVDVQTILPRITYQTSIDIRNPGVNYFAFVDATAYSVVASDNIAIGGATAHTIVGNPANWQPFQDVMDGALSFDAFSGTTLTAAAALSAFGLPNATINTIRFFNSSIARGATFTAGSNIVTNVTTTGLQVGQVVRSVNGILPLATTYTITAIDAATNTITLSGNAQLSSSTDSLYVDATNSSTITIADTLTISQGAILQTTHAGNHVNTITGGTLTSALNNTDGTSADLIIHNWNPSRSLTIASVIADNTAGGRAVNLIQTGNGTTALSGANTYSGKTFIQGGVLRLDTSVTLSPNSNTRLEGGVIGLGYVGGFQRFIGNGAGQFSWVTSGGFAAYGAALVSSTTSGSRAVTVSSTTGLSIGSVVSGPGIVPGTTITAINGNGTDLTLSVNATATASSSLNYTYDRTVNIGGGGATLVWGTGGFVPDNDSLILGAQDADSTLIFSNGIDLGRKSRLIQVVSGRGAASVTDGRLTGLIQGDGGSLIKGGLGTLEISNTGNTYSGGTYLAEGRLISSSSAAFGTGGIFVGTTTDTQTSDELLTLGFTPAFAATVSNNITYGSANYEGVSVLSLGNNVNTLSGSLALNRAAGGNVLIQTSNTSNSTLVGASSGGVTVSGAISGSGGFTLTGSGTLLLTNTSNSYGSGTGSSGTAIDGATVIRNGILVVGANGALGGSTIELGDATFAVAEVAVATNGASVLGVDRNTVGYTANNVGSLGGSFLANGNGTVAGNGDAVPGAGAFYNISATIDGRTFLAASDVGKRILVKDEAASPERNGIYQIVQFNADGTMNMVRVSDFSTSANMLYGTQVAVASAANGGGTSAGITYFMAAPNVTSVNSSGASPVYWQVDRTGGADLAILKITNPAVTSITQNIDVNTNNNSLTAIYAANPITFSGNVTLQDLKSGVQELQTLDIETTASGSGTVFSGVIREASNTNPATDDRLAITVNGRSYGAGNVTFTNANTYRGGTEVVKGTLFVNNAPGGSGTGFGSVTINSTATLAGTGTIAPAAGSNVTLNAGSSLSVGLPTDTSGSQLTINLQTGSNFTLAGTLASPATVASILKLDLFSNQAGTTLAEVDQLVFTKTGTPTITLGDGAKLVVNNVNNLAPSSFAAGDQWKLIDWAGITPTGTFTFTNLNGTLTTDFTNLPVLQGSFAWDISQLYTAGIITVAIPEPERLLLIILSLMALGWRRRRRQAV
jgi:autotransporter-associated beta strand protein